MKSNDKPLKSLIQEFVEAHSLHNKLNHVRVIDKWEGVVGPVIAKHTSGIYISRRTLYVELDSSIVRNELFLLREKIIAELNQGFSKSVIDNIILK